MSSPNPTRSPMMTKSKMSKKATPVVVTLSNCVTLSILVVAVLVASSIPPCQGFFFPKSFFSRKQSNPPPPPPPLPSPQQHPRILNNNGGHHNGQQHQFGNEPLQSAGTNVEPSLRIVNRPPPPRNNDNGPVPGAGFHVPKELCLACEKVPWVPFAGGEKHLSQNVQNQGQQQQQQQQQQYYPHQQQQQHQQQTQQIHSFNPSGSGSSPTKTIVINALGEAQGPVPVPPAVPNRRPFAIQFDGSQSGNQVGGGYQEAPKNIQGQQQFGGGNTVQVQPQQQQQQQYQQQQQQPQQGKPEQRPVTFQIFQAQSPNQPPTLLQPVQQQHIAGLNPPPIQQQQPGVQQVYGRPTVLQPVNVGFLPPPTPPQHVAANVNVQGNQHQQLPPPNPLTVGTIIASHQNTGGNVPEFQKIEQAKLVYHEHFTSPPSPPSGPPAPQNFKLPIISHPTQLQESSPPQPEGGYNTNNVNAAAAAAPPPPPPPQQVPQQQNFGPPPPPPPPQQQNNYASRPPPAPQGGYNNRPGQLFLQMRPPAPYQVQPQQPPRPSANMKPPGPMIHYGQPIRIPNNIGPQRPSGQVHFPPPQAFLQLGPPPPLPQGQQQQNVVYGAPRPETTNSIESLRQQQQDERRPSPSGQVFNIQPSGPSAQNVAPQNNNNNNKPLASNPVPVPIPVPTTVQNSNPAIHDSGERPRRPDTSQFTQETGWEIIPSIQTDLTHLFTSDKGKAPSQGNELPVPVPIPVPESHPPKSPIFIVTANQQQQQPQPQQQQPLQPQQKPVEAEPQIKVQDVSYHEESRNPVPTGASSNSLVDGRPSQAQSQHQGVFVHSSPGPTTTQQHQQNVQVHVQYAPPQPHQFQQQQQQLQPVQQQQQQIIRPRPFILGVPTGPSPVIFRPRPQQHFEPLHPSIMTALNHAQQTSLLTHQYLSQSNVGGPIRDNTIYVSPVGPAGLVKPTLHQVHQSIGVAESVSNSVAEQQQQNGVNQGIDPRIPKQPPTSSDQSAVNCQTAHQWLIPITTHQKQQQEAQQLEEQDATSQEELEVNAPSSVDESIAPSAGPAPTAEEDDQSTSVSEHDELEQEPSLTPQPQPTLASFASTTAAAGGSSPGIRGSISVQDNGNKGSYVIYYPRPVSKSPVYWVQPSRTVSQGVVRLSPQLAPVSPSVASTLVSWSRPRVVVASQFRTGPPVAAPTQESRAEEIEQQEPEREETSSSGSSEQAASSGQTFDESIPYGQKLGVGRDHKGSQQQTPYDIISVNGADESAQSLEETDTQDHSQQDLESSLNQDSSHDSNSEISSAGNEDIITGPGNDFEGTGPSGEYFDNQKTYENEANLQTVQETKETSNQQENDDADDERDDFGLRPQTNFRKPISTTVIHSPGVSSFQSLKLPNFKPHRVIVHDFTRHAATAAATGPSAADSDAQGNLESSESQQAPSSEVAPNSWQTTYKLKSPKLVETEAEAEEDGGILAHHSSESIQRPQGLSIQEVIASGPVSNADCVTTTHTGHLLTAFSSSSSTSPRTDSQGASSKARDVFLPLGSRFPAGRPSIFSAVRRPLVSSSLVTTPPSTTTSLPTTIASTSSERELGFSKQRLNYFGGNNNNNNPSGFAASIPVPIYRRPIAITNSKESLSREEPVSPSSSPAAADTVTYIRPQANGILSAEDIYKKSEVKEESNKVDEGGLPPPEPSTVSSTLESETVVGLSSDELIMSTERSSSFSVSVVDEKAAAAAGSHNDDDKEGLLETNNLQQVELPKQQLPPKVNIVQVTSVPVSSELLDPLSSTPESLTSTAVPQPASTSTKVVKTVRVRQRMRSGNFNGPLRTRFHGAGRVRVVHRPANQEYIRHFPEFQTHELDKLAKEEEQEVKNALIELKKSESIKSH